MSAMGALSALTIAAGAGPWRVWASGFATGVIRATPRYGAGRSGSSSSARAARSAFPPRAIQRFTAV